MKISSDLLFSRANQRLAVSNAIGLGLQGLSYAVDGNGARGATLGVYLTNQLFKQSVVHEMISKDQTQIRKLTHPAFKLATEALSTQYNAASLLSTAPSAAVVAKDAFPKLARCWKEGLSLRTLGAGSLHLFNLACSALDVARGFGSYPVALPTLSTPTSPVDEETARPDFPPYHPLLEGWARISEKERFYCQGNSFMGAFSPAVNTEEGCLTSEKLQPQIPEEARPFAHTQYQNHRLGIGTQRGLLLKEIYEQSLQKEGSLNKESVELLISYLWQIVPYEVEKEHLIDSQLRLIADRHHSPGMGGSQLLEQNKFNKQCSDSGSIQAKGETDPLNTDSEIRHKRYQKKHCLDELRRMNQGVLGVLSDRAKLETKLFKKLIDRICPKDPCIVSDGFLTTFESKMKEISNDTLTAQEESNFLDTLYESWIPNQKYLDKLKDSVKKVKETS